MTNTPLRAYRRTFCLLYCDAASAAEACVPVMLDRGDLPMELEEDAERGPEISLQSAASDAAKNTSTLF